MRKRLALALTALTLTLIACGRTPTPGSPAKQSGGVTTQAGETTGPLYEGTRNAVDHASSYGWSYWSYAGSTQSAALNGAILKPRTSNLLGYRIDGTHGTVAPTSANPPRFSLYKPFFWNGRLLVFAKGYGEADAPLRLPDEWGQSFKDLLNLYLVKGYGVAWTSCSENGYAVRDCALLTDQLKGLWEKSYNSGRAVGPTYLVGGSLGGQVVELLAEDSTRAKKYRGALATCGVLGGSIAQAKYVFDVRNLFDKFYPNLPSYPDGASSVKLPGRADGYAWKERRDVSGVLTDVYQPIDPSPSVMAWGNTADPSPTAAGLSGLAWSIDAAIKAKDANGAFVNLAKARALAAAYAQDGSSDPLTLPFRRIALRPDGSSPTYPGADADSAFLGEFSDWMRWALFFQLKGSEDMIFRAGGNPENSSGLTYFTNGKYGTTAGPIGNDDAYNLNAFAPTNGATYQYLKDNYEPSGNAMIPLLSMHNQYDPAAPAWHNVLYQQKPSFNSNNYARLTATGTYGHCNFTQDQITIAVNQLVTWAGDGTKRGSRPAGSATYGLSNQLKLPGE